MSAVRSILFLACTVSISLSVSAQEVWTDRTASAGIGGILNDVAYGDGHFVAVGTNSVAGLVHTSPDGITWTDRTAALGVGGILNGVAFGDGRFVVVGTNTGLGIIGSSPDGATWTDHTAASGVGGILNDVAFGNGVWVAVGRTGALAAIATSSNGTTWTNRTTTAGVSGDLHGIVFADGRFVAVGGNGSLVVLATSLNGADWTVHTSTNAIGGVAFDVTHDGAQFIATGDGTPSGSSTAALILTSSEGTSWTNRTGDASLGGIGYGLASGGGTTVAVGRTGAPGLLATSTNGVEWTNRTADVSAPGDLHGVVRGATTWVAVGTNTVNGVVMTSPAGSGSSGGEPTFVDDALPVASSGGSFTVGVTAGADQSWTATTEADWIFLSNASGTGDGTVNVAVTFNTSALARAGTIELGTDSLPVNQVGADLVAPTLSGYFDTSTGEIRLNWSYVAAASGYEIERQTDPDAGFVAWQSIPDPITRMASDPDPVGGANHQYRIRSVAGTLASAWSSVLSITAPPSIPTGLAAVARNASQIELTWNDVSGEAGYLLYRAGASDSFFQNIARVEPDETRFVDSGLEAETLYRYQVEAESNIYGRVSAEASTTTLAETRSIVWNRAESNQSTYYGAAYGGGVAVIVGSAGRVTRSTDGVAWAEVAPPTSRTLRAVDFGGGRFVAVGDGGTVVRSTDGLAWASGSGALSEDLAGVAYFDGAWYAVGAEGGLMRSADGDLWTGQTSPAATGFVDLFAGDRLVAIEDTGRMVVSADGATWAESRADAPTDATEPFFWTRTAGAFGGSAYSVVGPNSYHSSSSDALSWSEQPGGTFNYYEAVAYGTDRFVAVGLNGRTGWSTSGSGYISGGSQETSLYAITYGFDRFIAAGERALIVSSPGGASWTELQAAEGTVANLSAIAGGEGRLVAFGNPDFGAVSLRNLRDGNGWVEQALSVAELDFDPDIYDVEYIAGRFIAVGNEGLVLTSEDGVSWSTRRTESPGAINDFLRSVETDGMQVLAAGGADKLIRSLDGGLTWAPVEGLADAFNIWELAWGPRWVGHFGGFGTLSVNHSVDGSTWTGARVNGVGTYTDTLVGGELDAEPLFVAAGADFSGGNAQAMVSWDGRNWNAQAAPGIDGSVNASAAGAGLFVAVGQSGALVWASLDGMHWSPAPDGFLPESVEYNGGFRDLAYFDGRFYGVGYSGLIVEMSLAASDFVLPGTGLAIPTVTVTPSASSVRISWVSESGFNYQVKVRDDLATGAWSDVGAPIAGTGGALFVDLPLTGPMVGRFWAIERTE